MAGSEKLLRDRFTVKSVSHFFKYLKELGERLLPIFKKINVRYEMNQFVAAAIVSGEEIEKEDISVINQANHKLDDAGEDVSHIYADYSFSFNRLVVLMNTTKPKTHGEARLLDPDGKIRKEVLSEQDTGLLKEDCKSNFLGKLKNMFANDFVNKPHSYIICIFSHNIPCTETSHQCVKILDEFARKQSTEVIIAYEDVFFLTDKTEALRVMRENDKIYCLLLKESRSPPSTTKSSRKGCGYIKDSRMEKTKQKAKQKRKYPSRSNPSEKKKRKSYERENPDESSFE